MAVQKITTMDFCAACAKYSITEPEALNLLASFHSAGLASLYSLDSLPSSLKFHIWDGSYFDLEGQV